MYILLSGKPPFDGDTNAQILRSVSEGKADFTGAIWQMISPEGIDFIQ